MSLFGFWCSTTIGLLLAAAATASPGSVCNVNTDCVSGICRLNEDGITKSCCSIGSSSDCVVCASLLTSVSGTCLSYGSCNTDNDCADVCRQGHSLPPGEKTCCRNSADSTACDVCTIFASPLQSSNITDLPLGEGGVCVAQAEGESCLQFDDECLAGRCVKPFLGSADAKCCSGVADSCTECNSLGNCIANNCSSCAEGESCSDAFSSGEFGCCKAEVNRFTCEGGCNFNGDCLGDAGLSDGSIQITLVILFLVVLLCTVLSLYAKSKMTADELAFRTPGANGGFNSINAFGGAAPVRVITPDYDSHEPSGLTVLANDDRPVHARVMLNGEMNRGNYIVGEVVTDYDLTRTQED